MLLHAFIHLFVREINPLMDKRLPTLIEGSIIEILGGKGGLINHGIARIVAVDDVLFDQLYDATLPSSSILLYACKKRLVNHSNDYAQAKQERKGLLTYLYMALVALASATR